ncbi:BamA/TamA family outer membrane protein [Sphingomonas rhizophila]|uniref:BamA/TamA family outer membrane protein n=1 Tax=Sphingomonas rhizophila TaxID=2071607 RepID=A0A7G9SCL9_9SPHN|nr:BamA/TamA family outer membrane protein [Sphingomonas rhizophila]QNN65594.1 BamA/TamA family outer membrane protein [Sphingomonas rhizophila]
MVVGSGRGAAFILLAAGAASNLTPALARAQVAPTVPPATDPGGLDPSAPLDPMTDIGVAWPDMNAPDAVADPTDPAARPVTAGATDDLATLRRYSVALSGMDSVEEANALRDKFDEQSALVEGEGKPVNAAQIDRRARADSELLAELLRADGYYDAEVEPQIDTAGGSVAVTLAATPGERYRFAGVELPGLDGAASDRDDLRAAFAVKAGDPVVAEKVIAAGIALQVELGQRGFATANIGEQDIVIDHEAREARLVLPVTPGPVAKFGSISVSGRPPFSARHVGNIARFKRGDRFDQADVDDLRRALVATGLVSSVEVRQVPIDAGRTIDLAVKLEPAPMRTIAGELGYGTGEGIRAEASWQHRNFFNPEGALTLRAVAGTQEQLASATVRRNNFGRRDRAIYAVASASHIDRDAYEAKTLSLAAGLERQSNFIFQKRWTWSIGAELVASDERDTIVATAEERRRTFFIGALPASLTYDGSDNLLDPTRGFRLGGRLSPELSLQGGASGYAKAQVDASAYQPVSDRLVIAGRVRVGQILGAGRDDIAPSRRFYAGGGGSVRGYGYQALGPRDADNNPIGGKSLAEFAVEGRFRLGNFGIVPFFDGGTLSSKAKPDFKGWQFGAGVGARYYSSFGPIRIDVGTPFNRQPGDSRIAVTVSLGQAF